MAGVKVGDRVKETTTTTGTGSYDLDGAASCYQTFVDEIGDTEQCFYVCDNEAYGGTDWEMGIGTIADASPDTLSRDVILKSSNGGSAVDWGGGTKDIYCDVPAEQLVNLVPTSKTADYTINRPGIYDNLGASGHIKATVDNVPGMVPITLTNLLGTYEHRVAPPSGARIIYSGGTMGIDEYLAICDAGGTINCYVNNQGNLVVISQAADLGEENP